ncbi:hypothetical protein CEXT_467361 [Caerostris extrusa]|uniref:Uncharacterized protein n=1 Tax=Caerostris extrusa TaxID=172846 RepID=A0AAV4NAL0_CAEEX|nr:hypothetical protein CEXT_467361 [Caerostris extrusa]
MTILKTSFYDFPNRIPAGKYPVQNLISNKYLLIHHIAESSFTLLINETSKNKTIAERLKEYQVLQDELENPSCSRGGVKRLAAKEKATAPWTEKPVPSSSEEISESNRQSFERVQKGGRDVHRVPTSYLT